ncbi:MAG: TraR/DksA family transcriptional regulator [Planctomycetaceae bacterium]
MARQDALLKLHSQLIAQRDELRKLLGVELGSAAAPELSGEDSYDSASGDADREVTTQLAVLESRELAKVERAIQALKEGRYGQCEGCEKKIPVARLNVLPYTTLCIDCQRKLEEGHHRRASGQPNWEAAYDFQVRLVDSELTLADIKIDE